MSVIDGRPLQVLAAGVEYVVGSGRDADVRLDHELVSRRHARIVASDGVMKIEDLGSKNGTFIHGERISVGSVKPGEVVAFGPVALDVQPIHVADATSAIRLQQPPRRLVTGVERGDATDTRSDREPAVPRRWLEVMARTAAAVAAGRRSEALAHLADTAGAAGALLLVADRGGLPAVTAAGSVPTLDACTAALARRLAMAPPTTLVCTHDLHDLTPPLLAVAGRTGSGWHALALVGEIAAREHVAVLLGSAFAVFGAPAVSGPPALPGELPELVLPNGHVVPRSAVMRQVYQELRSLARGDVPVLLAGETGTGKEELAKVLHLSSPRAGGPFVAVNCAALPAELIEAELFGIARGVATGVEPRSGRFLQADGGILFLDEVGDLPLGVQAKLLRALQIGGVQPVGAATPTPVDIRVVAATNRDLERDVEAGRFRRDLYYRLAGYPLQIPPLRVRRGDIAALVEALLGMAAHSLDVSVAGLSARALELLVAAPWPGNIRELQHEITRLVYRARPGEVITSELLSPALSEPAAPPLDDTGLDLGRRLADYERCLLKHALGRTGGNKAAAARLLGLTRNGLLGKLKRHRLG